MVVKKHPWISWNRPCGVTTSDAYAVSVENNFDISVTLQALFCITLQGTNISPTKALLSRWFSFSPGEICFFPGGIYGMQIDVNNSRRNYLFIRWYFSSINSRLCRAVIFVIKWHSTSTACLSDFAFCMTCTLFCVPARVAQNSLCGWMADFKRFDSVLHVNTWYVCLRIFKACLIYFTPIKSSNL